MLFQTLVTGKNQVTIPAAAARALNIQPGTRVEWRLNEEHGTLTLQPVESRETRVRRLEGILRPYLRPGEDPVADLIREREEDDEESVGA